MSNNSIPGWKNELDTRSILQCKGTKLWRLRVSGQLIWSRIGRTVYYKESSILALLETNAIDPSV